ncbi:Phosphocarrier protein, nitrogen regulation associated [hydrothermal vent metagenome]|uniref:Phosphocarrier protein, nitrogen regulation associated n=1 Tax=hydrothermal vent metagenome TaxID=652676 RepID=A0A3B0R3F9_9ZZZZ
MSAALRQTRAVIVNDKGLHARAAAKFVAKASEFSSDIHVCCNGERVNANSIMELLMLACHKGKEIHIEAEGEDATAALDALGAMIDAGFGENDETT